MSAFVSQVTYNVYGFLEKNRDKLGDNLFDCMKNSMSPFVANLFSAEILDTGSMKEM